MTNTAAEVSLARQLVDSDLLSRVFFELRRGIVERWSQTVNRDEREHLHATYQACEQLEEQLRDECDRLAKD